MARIILVGYSTITATNLPEETLVLSQPNVLSAESEGQGTMGANRPLSAGDDPRRVGEQTDVVDKGGEKTESNTAKLTIPAGSLEFRFCSELCDMYQYLKQLLTKWMECLNLIRLQLEGCRIKLNLILVSIHAEGSKSFVYM